MKKVLVLASLALFAACNSNEPAKNDSMKSGSDSTTTMQEINSPYAIGYSSKFAMDDPKNAETLLTLWKDWDNGNLSAHKDMFADSVEMHFADGSMMHTSRDSALANAQNYRNTFASSVDRVDAIMAVKSTDKNENWALIWGMEKDTDKKGKIDSFYLQETWRFNKDGKANLFYQFKAAGAPPKK
ncbi:MAG: hypothetical protein ACHQF0_05285 [Chitinophagales bacterium]